MDNKSILDINKNYWDNNAAELWGMDMSTKQIENANKYLTECGYTRNG